MLVKSFHFSMFSSFTFSYLGCTLGGAENAIKALTDERPRQFSFDLGHYTLDEIAVLENGSSAPRKSNTRSYIALLFQAADTERTLSFSNLLDGWVTLCNAIASRSKTDLYTFSFSADEDPNARNAFEYRDYSSPQVKERVVHAMKDPQWVFYQKGEPLYFEDVNNYKKRKIRDRINKQILISYCKRLSLNIEDPDFLNPPGAVLRIQHSY